MTADQAWAAASLRRFGPMSHRGSKVRILEGRVEYELPTQVLTFAAAENLAAAGLAETKRHGQECFSCTLTREGELALERLLAGEASS